MDRREFLAAGGAAAVGMVVPQIAQAAAAERDDVVERERAGRQANGSDDVPLDFRVAAEFRRVNVQANTDRDVPVVKVARDGEPVAAVVTAAAKDQAFPPAAALDHVDGYVHHRPGGVLHQDEAGDVVVLNGPPVDLPHLGASEADRLVPVVRHRDPGAAAVYIRRRRTSEGDDE